MGVRTMKQKMWLGIIRDCRQSEMTVKEYCRTHSLSEKSYWYFHKKLGDQLEEQMTLLPEKAVTASATPVVTEFAELRISPRERLVTLRRGNQSIEIEESVSEEFLRKLIRVMNCA